MTPEVVLATKKNSRSGREERREGGRGGRERGREGGGKGDREQSAEPAATYYVCHSVIVISSHFFQPFLEKI